MDQQIYQTDSPNQVSDGKSNIEVDSAEKSGSVATARARELLSLENKPKPYKYDKIDTAREQIRLFRIDKSKNSIFCIIDTFELDAAPEYHAVSYEWGPATVMRDACVNDGVLKIRDNLYQLLLRLLHDEEEVGYLWVDQICINQADVGERNHQVGLMSQVYSCAASVIIWLGDCGILPDYELREINLEFWGLEDFEPDYVQDCAVNDKILTSLLQNNYFSRLWIIQEILLAKKRRVCISTEGARRPRWYSWDDLQKAHFIFGHNLPNAMKTGTIYWLIESAESEFSLWKALRCFSESDCQEPRDKVYGLLGIIKAGQRVPVDYSRIPCELVLDVVRVILSERIDLGGFNPMDWCMSNGVDVLVHDLVIRLGNAMELPPRQMLGLSAFLDGVLTEFRWACSMYSSGSSEYAYYTPTSQVPLMGFEPWFDKWWFENDDGRYVVKCYKRKARWERCKRPSQ